MSVRKKVRSKMVRKIKSVYQNRTSKNSDESSNDTGFGGTEKVRKHLSFCHKRNRFTAASHTHYINSAFFS